MNVFNGCLTRLLFYQITEIIGRKMQLVGAPGYSWQADLFRLIRIEVLGHQFFKAYEYIPIDSLTGNKLTVVKTKEVVEQRFNIGSNNAAAIPVDVVVQFFFYFGETVEDGLAFALGYMQSLVHFIGKESIFFYLTGEKRSTQQIGVKQQSISFGLSVSPPSSIPAT